MISWLRAHWRPVAVALGLVVSFAAGWAAHRPHPKVEIHATKQVATTTSKKKASTTHAQAAQASTSQVVASASEHRHLHVHQVVQRLPSGAETITTDTDSDDESEIHVELAQQITVHLDSVSAAVAQADEHQVEHVDLQKTVTPEPPPSWRVEGMLGTRIGWPLRPVYGGEISYRMLGPFWLGAWVTTAPEAGISLGVSW